MATSKLVYRHQTYAGTVFMTAALVLALVILPVVSTWMFADGVWQAAATSADKPSPDGGKGSGSSGGKGNSSGGKGQGNGGGGQGSGGSSTGGGSTSGGSSSSGSGQGTGGSSSGANSGSGANGGSSSSNGGNAGSGNGGNNGGSTGGNGGNGGTGDGASGSGSSSGGNAGSSGAGTSGGGQEGGNDAESGAGDTGGHDGDESSVVGLDKQRTSPSGLASDDDTVVLVAPADEIWENVEDTYCGCDMPRGYKGCVPVFTEAQCRHIVGPGAWTDLKEDHYYETFPMLLRAALIERRLLTPNGLVRQRPKAAEGLDNVEAKSEIQRFDAPANTTDAQDRVIPGESAVSRKRSRVGLFSRLRGFFAGA